MGARHACCHARPFLVLNNPMTHAPTHPPAAPPLQVFSCGTTARWLPISEFVMAAFGFAWWGLFAAVDTSIALKLRPYTDYRQVGESGALAGCWGGALAGCVGGPTACTCGLINRGSPQYLAP